MDKDLRVLKNHKNIKNGIGYTHRSSLNVAKLYQFLEITEFFEH